MNGRGPSGPTTTSATSSKGSRRYQTASWPASRRSATPCRTPRSETREVRRAQAQQRQLETDEAGDDHVRAARLEPGQALARLDAQRAPAARSSAASRAARARALDPRRIVRDRARARAPRAWSPCPRPRPPRHPRGRPSRQRAGERLGDPLHVRAQRGQVRGGNRMARQMRLRQPHAAQRQRQAADRTARGSRARRPRCSRLPRRRPRCASRLSPTPSRVASSVSSASSSPVSSRAASTSPARTSPARNSAPSARAAQRLGARPRPAARPRPRAPAPRTRRSRRCVRAIASGASSPRSNTPCPSRVIRATSRTTAPSASATRSRIVFDPRSNTPMRRGFSCSRLAIAVVHCYAPFRPTGGGENFEGDPAICLGGIETMPCVQRAGG